MPSLKPPGDEPAPPGPGAAEDPAALSRRAFVALVGSSTLAALPACSRPSHPQVLPYARSEPEVTPGVPSHYATTTLHHGYGVGLVLESHGGRPTKVEGNPLHPESLGATTAADQALVLGLYDPHRARGVLRDGRPGAFLDLARRLRRRAEEHRARDGGARLRLLLEPTSSPTLLALRQALVARFPAARVVTWSPLHRHAAYEGARLAFGTALETLYDFERADRVVTLDADPLGAMPGALRHARGFGRRRALADPSQNPLRLYALECAWSPTGTAADHRFRVRSRDVGPLALALAAALARAGVFPPALAPALHAPWRTAPPHVPAPWLDAVARDLAAHRGRALVVVGDRQPPWVHALGHALNAALEAPGRTLRYHPSVLGDPGSDPALAALAAEMHAGAVETLLLVDTNPVYAAPAELRFAAALRRVPEALRAALYVDETAALCRDFVPLAHPLEGWGDARAPDGTASFAQPLLEGLFEGHAEATLLALLLDREDPSPRTLVREHWRAAHGGPDFDAFWERALRDGVVSGSASAPRDAPLAWSTLAPALARARADLLAPPPSPTLTLDLELQPSVKLADGRYGNNPWLQELPDPVTHLTWGNAALVGPATAQGLGLSSGDVVELSRQGRAVTVPALVVAGQAEGAVVLALGYGRAGGETVARGVGTSAYALRTLDAPWFAPVTLRRTGATAPLAITQPNAALEGRTLALETTLARWREDPAFTRHLRGRTLSLYPVPYHGEQWGMAIDLNACVACGACMVACQAENNVPVVGPAGVLRAREMHWLRIDQYLVGPPGDPRVLSQPMLCQHCEKAPCEYVCPVNATVHSPDGLNEMIYNRCVGTRYCSNNCPYKIRRFNFFEYQSYGSEGPRLRDLALNPDVTVRSRGVVEKCTYCVQRIRRAGIDARIAGRPLHDGDVRTACQQACPTGAIAFGNVSDPRSQVARRQGDGRAYAALHELGTQPRTQYLVRVRNVNPELG